MLDELVLDASVAAKLFFEEIGSDRAISLAESGVALIAPDFIHVEFASIAAKKVRRGEISAGLGEAAVADLPALLHETSTTEPLVSRAFAIAVTHGCSAYDSLYLSLAESRRCKVVTADERLVRRAADTGLGHLVQAL